MVNCRADSMETMETADYNCRYGSMQILVTVDGQL